MTPATSQSKPARPARKKPCRRRAARAVPASPRASVVADYQEDHPPAWPIPPAPAGIPEPVWIGSYVAALARAEHCDVLVVDGHLELRCRYNPSPQLETAFALHGRLVAGVLGFGVHLLSDSHGRVYAASWPFNWQRN